MRQWTLSNQAGGKNILREKHRLNWTETRIGGLVQDGGHKKHSLAILFSLILLIALIGQRTYKAPRPVNGTDVKFTGNLYSKSLEVLDNTGYTIYILLCPLADENMSVNITPEGWIDKRAATYVLLPPESYPPGFLEDVPKEIGKFRIVKAMFSNFSYRNGTIMYWGYLKKGECTVLSIRAVFREAGLPRKIDVSSLSTKELILPDAVLRGINGSYRLEVWVPWDYGNWSLSVLVPRKLGRNTSYALELRDYLNAILSNLQKGIFPLNSLKRPTTSEPEPPDSYCTELSAPGDLIYTQRALDESTLYSDGTYFETDFSGNSTEEITLNVSSKGCSPAVWFIFHGKAENLLTGPFLSSVQIGAREKGIVWSSKIELIDEGVVEPTAH